MLETLLSEMIIVEMITFNCFIVAVRSVHGPMMLLVEQCTFGAASVNRWKIPVSTPSYIIVRCCERIR